MPSLVLLVGAIIYTTVKSSKPCQSSVDNNSSHGITKKLSTVYGLLFTAGLGAFFSLSPKDDSQWQPEVENILSVERHMDNPNLVTVHNVRNFTWHSNLPASIDSLANNYTYNSDNNVKGNDLNDNTLNGNNIEPRFKTNEVIARYNKTDDNPPTQKWETRDIDLSKLTGVDVINSYWLGEQIGHTLVSFRFSNDRPLTYSFEIRKEVGESFSTLGGFFRKFELSLIAAEERDIVYTRSNWRGEQVYLLPLDNLTQAQVRQLFEHYLDYADRLQDRPEWYNTAINNCTNLIFNMARDVDAQKFPLDYRIWATGYIPNYLYDNGLLPKTHPNNGGSNHKGSKTWDMQTWYEQAYINPKTSTFTEHDNESMTAYSRLIRQGLPIPTLNTSNNDK